MIEYPKALYKSGDDYSYYNGEYGKRIGFCREVAVSAEHEAELIKDGWKDSLPVPRGRKPCQPLDT